MGFSQIHVLTALSVCVHADLINVYVGIAVYEPT